jgi:starch synthase
MLAEPVYAAGNLFLMPSSFEPCGISQMLAMRHGQPCVAHGVGGLIDTIHNGETGFIFEGDTAQEQADNFVHATLAALRQRADDPASWKAICDQAKAQRFSWALAAERTVHELYGYTDE